MICSICREKIRFWQKWVKSNYRDQAHEICEDAWRRGHDAARFFCERENRLAGLPAPDALFGMRMLAESKNKKGTPYNDPR